MLTPLIIERTLYGFKMAQSPDMSVEPATVAPPAVTAGAARDPHLVATGLGRRFGAGGGGDWAVHNATFEVGRGEFFGLLGPSGCGKSTTLNLVAGFLEPTAGEVRLSGKLLNGVPPHRRGTAMVFQD